LVGGSIPPGVANYINYLCNLVARELFPDRYAATYGKKHLSKTLKLLREERRQIQQGVDRLKRVQAMLASKTNRTAEEEATLRGAERIFTCLAEALGGTYPSSVGMRD
jgi:hypothetical protein